MTNQHPIIPPTELLEQWVNNSPLDRGRTIATWAAQWGADEELKACCDAIYVKEEQPLSGGTAEWLHKVRRLNLKEEALKALAQIERTADAPVITDRDSLALIRRALEQS